MTPTTKPNAYTRKPCKTCGIRKPEADFYIHPTSGVYARCKVCMIAARKAAYRANPEPTKASAALSKARRKAEGGQP